MSADFLIGLAIGILPVLGFLAALLALDSFKLVSLKSVIFVILAGTCVAGLSYLVNQQLVALFDVDRTMLSRYIAPLVEEILKGAVIVALIRARRIGFLIDAAIFGFAVGAGFAVIENVYYLRMFPDEHVGVWIVRGFGTAIMHGGATGIFAMMGLAVVDKGGSAGVAAFTPGMIVAVVLHSIFNHFFFSPIFSTLGILVILPPLMYMIFQESEKEMRLWLGTGFDTDAELLALINSGQLSDSPVGRYLHELRDRFHGPIVADLLCYLRLYTELSLRAKGLLMMREAGFNPEPDNLVKSMFQELKYLEASIGTVGRLAIEPLLRISHKELWQMYMLGK